MPRTTAPRLRHEIIDECLRNRLQQWSLDKLKGKVNEHLRERYGLQGVADRTIDKDLKAMKAIYGAPIVSRREEKHVWYSYSEDFSLMHLPLEEADLLKLNEAVHLLSQIKGFTIADEIEKVVRRLEKKVKIEVDAPAIIAFENSPPANGIENLQDLFLAIKQKKVLKLGYRSFKANKLQEIVVHPYFLKEFNNRWFLVALGQTSKNVTIYGLDRMHWIKVTANEYFENTSLTVEDYFKNVIGVTVSPRKRAETIVLRFETERAPYVMTKPLHATQRIIEITPVSSIISIEVVPNRELETLLLGFGSDVEVLKPDSLRASLFRKITKMVECYRCKKE